MLKENMDALKDLEKQGTPQDSEPFPFQYEFQEGNPADNGFKWSLIVGKVIGVVPHTISLKPRGGNLRFSWRSISMAHSLFLVFLGIILLIPQAWWSLWHIGSYHNILDEMTGLQGPMFQCSVIAGFIYMIKGGPKLIHLLQQWSETMKILRLPTQDTCFPRFCLKISILVLGIGCFENILYDFYSINKQAAELEGDSIIEKLYKIEGRALHHYVPYHSYFTSLLVIYAAKFGTYCWNFGDIFLIILCRALSYKFTQFNQELQTYINGRPNASARTTLHKNGKPKTPMEKTLNGANPLIIQPATVQLSIISGDTCPTKEVIWRETREKLFALFDLTSTVTGFVSPLVLICYVYNIFFIILNFLRFIHDGQDNSAYVYVSTVQLVMRVILVTYHSSQVYHSTEEIHQTIENFSDNLFSRGANRLERMLARHPVGVTILGAIVITRKFFISILSFLFTTEIILLQAMSTSASSKKNESAKWQ